MPAAAAGGRLGGDTVSKPVDTSCLATFYHTRRTVLTTTLLTGLATTTGLASHSSDWFGEFSVPHPSRDSHVPG